jgi:hypothetical protein
MPQQIQHTRGVPDFATGGEDSGFPQFFADLAQTQSLCAQNVCLLDRDRLVAGRSLLLLTVGALLLSATRQSQESGPF